MANVIEQYETLGGDLITIYSNGRIKRITMTDEQYNKRRLEERWDKPVDVETLRKEKQQLSIENEKKMQSFYLYALNHVPNK